MFQDFLAHVSRYVILLIKMHMNIYNNVMLYNNVMYNNNVIIRIIVGFYYVISKINILYYSKTA